MIGGVVVGLIEQSVKSAEALVIFDVELGMAVGEIGIAKILTSLLSLTTHTSSMGLH